MKVRITFEISTEDRLAIAAHYGSDRPASHSEVLNWIRSEVYATLEGMYPDDDGDDEEDRLQPVPARPAPKGSAVRSG